MAQLFKRLFGREAPEIRSARKAASDWGRKAAELEKEGDAFVHDGAAHDATSQRVWEEAMTRIQLLASWGVTDAVPAYRTQAGLAALLETSRRDLNYDGAAMTRARASKLRKLAARVKSQADLVASLSGARRTGGAASAAPASLAGADPESDQRALLEQLVARGTQLAQAGAAEALRSLPVIRDNRRRIASVSDRLARADEVAASLRARLQKLPLAQRRAQLADLVLAETVARADEAALQRSLDAAAFEPRGRKGEGQRLPPCVARALVLLARASVSRAILSMAYKSAGRDPPLPVVAPAAGPGSAPASPVLSGVAHPGSASSTTRWSRRDASGAPSGRRRPGASDWCPPDRVWADGLSLSCDWSAAAAAPLVGAVVDAAGKPVVASPPAAAAGAGGDAAAAAAAAPGAKKEPLLAPHACTVPASLVSASLAQLNQWHWLEAAAAADHPSSVTVAAAAATAVRVGAAALPSAPSPAASPHPDPELAEAAARAARRLRSRTWGDVCGLATDAFSGTGAAVLGRDELVRDLGRLAAGLGLRTDAGDSAIDFGRVWLAESLRLRRHRRFRSLVSDQRLREGRLLAGWSMSNLCGRSAGLYEDDEAAQFLGATALLPAREDAAAAAAGGGATPSGQASSRAAAYAAARGAAMSSPAALHIRQPRSPGASSAGGSGEESDGDAAGDGGGASPASKALREGAGGAALPPPATPSPAKAPRGRSASAMPSPGASQSRAIDEELENTWRELHDAVTARRREEEAAAAASRRSATWPARKRSAAAAAAAAADAAAASAASRSSAANEEEEQDLSVPTPRVVRALLEYLHGEVRIAYAVRDRWGEELSALLVERQRLRAEVLPIVRAAQGMAASRGGQAFRDASAAMEVVGVAPAAALAAVLSSSPEQPAAAAGKRPGLEWAPACTAEYSASLRRLTRSLVFSRLARAATGGVRTLAGERAGVGRAPRTQFLERLWCASLAAASRISLARIDVNPDFLAELHWAPWLPPYWLSGRLLAAMDAEVSGAGLGDPHRVKELLLSAVEMLVWEAGERVHSARVAAGKPPKRVDVGAEDLLPLLVLAVSRCSAGGGGGDDDCSPGSEASLSPASSQASEAAEGSADGGSGSGSGDGGASGAGAGTADGTAAGADSGRSRSNLERAAMAPQAMRCPWRLPLQTLNYIANFAIGRDSAAGRLSYLVITLHSAITFVMQRAKEAGAEAAMQAMARARRVQGERMGGMRLAAVGSSGNMSDRRSRGGTPGSEAGPGDEAAALDAFTDSDTDDEESPAPGLSRKPSRGAAAAAAGAGGAAEAEAEAAELDALERMEAAAAEQAMASLGRDCDEGPAAAGAASGAGAARSGAAVEEGGPDSAAALAAGSAAAADSGAESGREKRVRVDMALQRLASQGASEQGGGRWTPGVDAGSDMHAGEDGDEDTVKDEDPGVADELLGMTEEEATMIAMPGDADKPDREGMSSLKKWLGQQELLEDTVEILT
ncbi:hypothetical protein FNF31_06000 [Cafeteria roenbergensis]|uniref:VPS9 domain-containing protein n=1 Tax=Cafeteria roenbergensis TaxID=33653 RepID=A0A5A8CUI2_CAFRO|nr:hypothetical protein FNF31_06000 [Cafeteria roenbergensis]